MEAINNSENTPVVSKNPLTHTIKREELTGNDEKLNSIFDRYDLPNENGVRDGVLSGDEIDLATQELSGIFFFSSPRKAETKAKLEELADPKSVKDFVQNFSDLISKKVFLNGSVSASAQSPKHGDCWLLAGINSLSYTANGRQIIKDSIKADDKGNITVELKGVGRSYTFSSEDVLKRDDFVDGDHDMAVLEMAFEEYRKDLVEENKKDPDKDYYTGSAKKNDWLNAGYPEDAIFVLTGKRSQVYTNKPGSYAIPEAIERALTKDNVKEYLDEMENNSDRYAVNCALNTKSYYKGHCYTVKAVRGDKVILVNPYDSGKEIEETRENFLKALVDFSLTDMGAPIEKPTQKEKEEQEPAKCQ